MSFLLNSLSCVKMVQIQGYSIYIYIYAHTHIYIYMLCLEYPDVFNADS